MIICDSITAIKKQLREYKNHRIAFVATMGNLHQGHLELVKRAQQLADKVIVSIYVNPLQFNQNSDFDNYPRTLEEDQRQLEKLNTDCLFLPTTQELYPHGQLESCKVFIPNLSDILEGEQRPGHFTGVTTVVNKLFNIVQPDIALFGEKDYQQLLLIRRMVADLNIGISIQSVETFRQPSGLAMSSRNNRLSIKQQKQASEIYLVLINIAKSLKQGQENHQQLQKNALEHLEKAGFKAEYVEIRRLKDLSKAGLGEKEYVILLAAWLADVRLIDNIVVSMP